MFKSPYDTLPCRMYRNDEIYKAVQMMIASGDPALPKVGGPMFATSQSHQEVTVGSHFVIDGAVNLPLFAHPIVIENLNDGKVVFYNVVADARDVTKRGYESGWKVTSQSEFNLIRTRLILEARWLMNSLSGAQTAPVLNFPMRMFSRWIGDALARRFNMDLDATVRVQAIAAFMYMSMHHGDTEIKDYELVDMAMKISRGINVPTAIVSEVLQDITFFSNVEEFCDALLTRVGSSKLDGLNPVVLYGIIRGSWFGKNASELVSVAIEHPPTFDALLHAAAGSSTLQRTLLGTLVKAELRDREALAFVETINHAILEKAY